MSRVQFATASFNVEIVAL